MAITGDLKQIREQVLHLLVNEFDASEELATQAVERIEADVLEEFDTVDELAEEVYDNGDYWED